jgi:aryl-alcohol dehydrogenase-like predicted oxidoreductase
VHKRTLGRTGLEVSEIGYGAWGIGKTMWLGADDDESLQARSWLQAVESSSPRA